MPKKLNLKKIINRISFFLCMIFFGLAIWVIILSYYNRSPNNPFCNPKESPYCFSTYPTPE